ncbi:NADPH-dependent F420 reductase [Marisediminicola antarctica]|nr:NAD(P)-binding domain-containing protein [Marisediminicola antarctica]
MNREETEPADVAVPMTTLGIIGAGNIGSQLARKAVQNGFDVVISNSRGPHTLADLIAELGPQATAGTTAETAEAGDVVVVTIPLRNIDQVPAAPLAGKVVIDTNNYYPQRDGNIELLDTESATVSGLLQSHLADSSVVKGFNHIPAPEITTDGTAPGTPGRRALAIAGDDDTAKAVLLDLYDRFGFDAVDVGSLDDSWRIERDQPGYGPRQSADELRAAIANAVRDKNSR